MVRVVKDLPASAGDIRDAGRPLCWEGALEESLATTLVFLPGESHEQRSLVGHSPKGHKESDTLSDCTYTEQLKMTQTWEDVSSNS